LNWSTRSPGDGTAERELRQLAREVLTPAQLEAYRLAEAGLGYRRIGAVLGIHPFTAKDRLLGAELRLIEALKEREPAA
jgi:DNA-binding CsgD family transcriptional regulator